MKTYDVKVRLPGGRTITIQTEARSGGQAKENVRILYPTVTVLGARPVR